jgi:hypothetical protein
VPAEPKWLWRGYLASGSLTMLAGHPFAGKSMLVAGLLRALHHAESFLGRTTDRTSAIVVTEEDDAALRQRAALLGLLGVNSEYVSRSSGALSLPWPELVATATEHAVKSQHGLLVVDTFPGLAGLAGDEENDAGAIAEKLRPLQQAAGTGLAVLFLHHMNRFGQPRGSKAFLGVVDVSTRFQREPRSSAFRLDSISRFPVATPAMLRGQLVREDGQWSYRLLNGSTEAPSDQSPDGSVDDRLRQAVLKAGRSGLGYADFESVAGLSLDIAKKRLPELYARNEFQRTGTGKKGDPYRYLLPNSGFSAMPSAKRGDRTESL